MADFHPAFQYMIKNEDSLVSGKITPEPNGGKARFGINSACHPEAELDGFYQMPRIEALSYAEAFYKRHYWENRGFNLIDDQNLATKLFDIAVNMGNGGELGVLQTALEVPVTHVLDQATKDALEQIPSDFMEKLVLVLQYHYQAIYDAHPDKYKGVLKGWMSRAKRVPA